MSQPAGRQVAPSMHHNRCSYPLPCEMGEVIYATAPGMGSDKTRPCLVLGDAGSELALLPLSSDTWCPRLNPSVFFNDGISFAVLDRAFTVSKSSVQAGPKRHISRRALGTCIDSLRAGVECGLLHLPSRVAEVALGTNRAVSSTRYCSRLAFKHWNNRS
jgi:hypothetical protein